MRWEDERYVRIYTRDTPDWLALGWEAQALFIFTMRKMDRAGLLELGKSGARGLAALVAMPPDVVERSLSVLLADGCLVLSGTILIAPNFIEAQETPQSDVQRKRESRARARDLASANGIALPSQNVTASPTPVPIRDRLSQNVTAEPTPVTGGHAASHAVTLYCAVPCRAGEALPPARARDHSEPGSAPDAPELDQPEPVLPYPGMSAVIAWLDERGHEAAFPSEDPTRSAVEKAITLVGVEVACERLLAVFESDRAQGYVTRPWLGWHLDAIEGRYAGAAESSPPQSPLPDGPPAFVALLKHAAETVASEAFRRDLAAARPEEQDGVLWLYPADPYHEARLKDPDMFGRRIPELAEQVGVTVVVGSCPESSPGKEPT